MKKYIICPLLVFAILFGLVACGKGAEESTEIITETKVEEVAYIVDEEGVTHEVVTELDENNEVVYNYADEKGEKVTVKADDVVVETSINTVTKEVKATKAEEKTKKDKKKKEKSTIKTEYTTLKNIYEMNDEEIMSMFSDLGVDLNTATTKEVTLAYGDDVLVEKDNKANLVPDSGSSGGSSGGGASGGSSGGASGGSSGGGASGGSGSGSSSGGGSSAAGSSANQSWLGVLESGKFHAEFTILTRESDGTQQKVPVKADFDGKKFNFETEAAISDNGGVMKVRMVNDGSKVYIILPDIKSYIETPASEDTEKLNAKEIMNNLDTDSFGSYKGTYVIKDMGEEMNYDLYVSEEGGNKGTTRIYYKGSQIKRIESVSDSGEQFIIEFKKFSGSPDASKLKLPSGYVALSSLADVVQN